MVEVLVEHHQLELEQKETIPYFLQLLQLVVDLEQEFHHQQEFREDQEVLVVDQEDQEQRGEVVILHQYHHLKEIMEELD